VRIRKSFSKLFLKFIDLNLFCVAYIIKGKIVLIEDNNPPLEPTLRDIISRGGVAAIARE
jgi:hypothetical protein